MDNRASDYFARVQPILGSGLRGKTVRASNLHLTGRVIELLASCMLEEVVEADEQPVQWPMEYACRGPALARPHPSANALLKQHLAWKNGFVPIRWRREGPGDLHLDARFTTDAPHVVYNANTRSITLHVTPGDPWSYEELAYATARNVRDILLGRMPWHSASIFHGHHLWPFVQTPFAVGLPAAAPAIQPDRHIMVIGCGSVGSEAIRLLAGLPVRWTLVDGGKVSVFNPQRQWFGTDDIGQFKVDVLARMLSPAPVRTVCTNATGDDVSLITQWCQQDRPDVVLLATGTSEHGPLAATLWNLGIAHVAACAYPQARFFEVTTVMPQERSPCLHCFRGHLYRGPESAVPMRDDVAQFLYRDIDAADRDRLYIDLVAEPATRIDTGRLAQVAARCVVEALAPTAQRGRWMQRMQQEGTTCLVGGNVVEHHADGGSAYGITQPGQVVRLGLPDVVGSGCEHTCRVCGRTLTVVHSDALPVAQDSDVDAALVQG